MSKKMFGLLCASEMKNMPIYEVVCAFALDGMAAWVEGGWKSCSKDIFVKAPAATFLFVLLKNVKI